MAAISGADGPSDNSSARWNTYISVDDLVASVERLVALGASVVDEPLDHGLSGRAAALIDPEGAEFRLWQPRELQGVQAANEPGAWNFSDLRTADVAAASAFYASGFGWLVDDIGFGPAIRVPGYGDHLEATIDPEIRTRQASAPEGFEDVIGAMAILADGETPHWHVTFTVADRDDAAAVVEREGGTVLSSGEDDWTRHATVLDPAGARFTVSQFAPAEWS